MGGGGGRGGGGGGEEEGMKMGEVVDFYLDFDCDVPPFFVALNWKYVFFGRYL